MSDNKNNEQNQKPQRLTFTLNETTNNKAEKPNRSKGNLTNEPEKKEG